METAAEVGLTPQVTVLMSAMLETMAYGEWNCGILPISFTLFLQAPFWYYASKVSQCSECKVHGNLKASIA